MKTFAISLMMLLVAATAMAGGANVEGSTVEFVSYDGTDLVIEICNASTDAEWHISSTFSLIPECAIVTAASHDFEETEAYDYEFTGLGTNVVTIAQVGTSSYGCLRGGDCMLVTLTLDTSACDEAAELCFDWDFIGDIWGDEPHQIEGSTCTGVVGTEDISLDSLKSMYR
ncbi:MAG: hypothetical protein GY780_06830 [bacterium]|nr:hypothetical protein [bacterium]